MNDMRKEFVVQWRPAGSDEEWSPLWDSRSFVKADAEAYLERRRRHADGRFSDFRVAKRRITEWKLVRP